jgi:hypothetical protein
MYERNEAMAAITAVWPAVAICPVIQREIAKTSAVPISRQVTAFANVLRMGSPTDDGFSASSQPELMAILFDKILPTIETHY